MAAHSLSAKIFDYLPFQGGGEASLNTELTHLSQRFKLWWFKRQAYRATLKELSSLSDWELDDIGIVRVNIPLIARQSADIAAARQL